MLTHIAADTNLLLRSYSTLTLMLAVLKIRVLLPDIKYNTKIKS
jgi:hypothetical protein